MGPEGGDVPLVAARNEDLAIARAAVESQELLREVQLPGVSG